MGWGCALNMWTMRHGNLIGPGTTVAQVDDDPAAIGAHRQVDLGVAGDVGVTARLAAGALDGQRPAASGGPARRPATSPATGRPGCGTGSPARSAGATCPTPTTATITGSTRVP